MEKKNDDLSPNDRAIIQEQITSALRHHYGGTVREVIA
jgi:hypothetical protein